MFEDKIKPYFYKILNVIRPYIYKMLNTTKIYLHKALNQIKNKFKDVKSDYGYIGLAACLAVAVKILIFYKIIGVTSNFLLVWLITCLLTYLLFSCFKNKWIPALIFLLLSVLMFADVTYSSFFNRYLSVNMFGAAGVLGDITESIKEVLKPWFFLIFADLILIFTALFLGGKEKSNEKSNDVIEILDFSQLEEIEIEVEVEDFSKLEEIEIKDFSQLEEINQTNEEEESSDSNKRAERIAKRNRKNKIARWFKTNKKPAIALLIILVLVFNVSGSFVITSLSNQEIYSYHVKDIISGITGKSMSGENSDYMYEVTDSYEFEKNGPLFGVAKGKNLIVIQMESLQNFVINREYNGQEITPNINQLIKENTIYFDNYYQQVGSGNTSDAEFATNNSVYGTLASYTYKLFDDNYFKGLPVLLNEQGYETAVYHAHENRDFWNRQTAYKSLGFETYYGGIGGREKKQYEMTEWMGWGLTDSEFFKQTMYFLKKMPQPFYSFIITISNHHPYIMMDKYQFLDILPEDKDTIVGNYLNSAAYTDYAIGQLIQDLKDEGLYDNSIIALYGDHLGLAKTDEEIYNSMSRLLGKEYDFDTMMNIPLIITVPGSDIDINKTVSISGGQLDFLPTIAYLMGFENLDTVYLGHNLLTIDSGFVAEQTYMKKGSFFQDDIVYEMSRDGVFENGRAWNKKTGKSVPVKDCYDGYMRSMGIINTSDYILNNDVLAKIYLENQNVGTAFSNKKKSVKYPDEIAMAGAPDNGLLGTNSLEALNASYDAGYRNIKVQLCWTKDKKPVMLSSWDSLDDYYNTDEDSEITLKKFKKLKMKQGLTSMDNDSLIKWVEQHPDVRIIAQVERSSDYFMKTLKENENQVFNQFIAEVPGTSEYTGLYNSILNINVGNKSEKQIIEFIELNNVPAVAMSESSAEGPYKKILNQDCISYVEEMDNGLIVKRN